MAKDIFGSTRIRKEVERIGNLIVKTMREYLKSQDANSSGKLSRSIDFRYIERNADGINMRFSMKDYGKFVEKGRKPGKMPPQKPIKGWIKSKGIAMGSKSLDASAFLIARSIKGTGTQAQPFIKPALEKGKREVNHTLTKEISKSLKATFNKSF